MFDHVLRRKVVDKKLYRGQLPHEKSKDGIRVLLVDVIRLTFLTDEPSHPTYRKLFLDAIELHLSERIGANEGVDLVVFAKMSLDPQFVFCCARGAFSEKAITEFVGDGRKLQILRRIGEFVIVGQEV